MAVIIASFFIIWLAMRKLPFLWLVLPWGLLLDFWWQQPLGLSGLEMLLFGSIFWLVFGQLINQQPKLKF